jgi:hypothetical protein
VVENCWPIPDADGPARGVLVDGPVACRRLGRWLVFRYEVRCWPDGVIAWVLARAGLPTDAIPPPAGGRAPGWQAGLAVAHRSPAMMGTASSKADQAEGHDAHTAAIEAGGSPAAIAPAG